MSGTRKRTGKLVCQSRVEEGGRQEINQGVCVCVRSWYVDGGCHTVGIKSSRAF